MTRPALVALVSVVAIAVVAAVLAFTLTVGGSTQGTLLDGVDAKELEGSSIHILDPVGEPSITAEEAISRAKIGARSDARANETVLVRLVNDTGEPPWDNLSWAVNWDPQSVSEYPASGGPGHPGTPRPRVCYGPPGYSVTFIDAMTGDFLFSMQASGPEVECPTPFPDDGRTPTPPPGGWN